MAASGPGALLDSHGQNWFQDSHSLAAKFQCSKGDSKEKDVTEEEIYDELPVQLGRRLGGISNLPPQLQAMIRKRHPLINDQIVDVVTALEGVCNIDEIIVNLFRMYGVVIKDRRQIANRLYRMVSEGTIVRVNGHKGIFALPPPNVAGKIKRGTVLPRSGDHVGA